MNNRLTFPRKVLPYYLAGVLPAYFLTSYFSILYTGLIPFLLMSLLFQILCGTTLAIFWRSGILDINWRKHRASLLALAVTASLPASALVISWQFPGLFDQRLITMDAQQLPVFLVLMALSIPGGLWVNSLIEKAGLPQSIKNIGLTQFMRRYRAGILLALLFFLAYFIFTQSLNFPGYYTRDQYFETDISDWIERLTDHPVDEILPVRAVHPAVLLILRPLVGLLSIILNGDKLQALFILSALAGSGCVFFTWLIVKQRTDSTPYALISASLLGASASHLLLSAMLETYIFSALALVSFCFLLQSCKTSLKFTVPMGVVIFGITITNLVQACILYFMKLPRIKVMIRFVLMVVLIVLLLNMLQVHLFPYARPIYNPSSLLAEQSYRYDPFEAPWKFRGRVTLVARVILLYGVVSPTPYILMEELGTNVPNFRTFQITVGEFQVAAYKGLAEVTAKLWATILGLAVILFITNLLKTPKQLSFPVSLILCMGFNLGLHILYGDDPMLYSPNWVYAVVLFVSSSFDKWANNKWLQTGLILFLGMMMLTNLELVHRILNASLPFYGS